MCGATRLWGDLCAELQEEANVRAVAQATQVEVLDHSKIYTYI
jgi:hypothetical protein